jgi:hypothetical protein
VIFLGAPLLGSSAAKLAYEIASHAPDGWSSEKRLLEDLKEDSVSVKDRLDNFATWLIKKSVPAVCYFEEYATDYSLRLGRLGMALGGILGTMSPLKTRVSI